LTCLDDYRVRDCGMCRWILRMTRELDRTALSRIDLVYPGMIEAVGAHVLELRKLQGPIHRSTIE
jgi:putative component of toxin-antitoxin plasmid stabilization module